jgi:hypothetical protein
MIDTVAGNGFLLGVPHQAWIRLPFRKAAAP